MFFFYYLETYEQLQVFLSMHNLFLETMRVIALAYLSLLLLVVMLFQFQNSSTAHGFVNFQYIETGSMSNFSPSQAKEGFRQNTGEGGEYVQHDEKRKIYTGPPIICIRDKWTFKLTTYALNIV